MKTFVLLLSCLACCVTARRLGLTERLPWLESSRRQGQQSAQVYSFGGDVKERQRFLLDVLLQVQKPLINNELIQMGQILLTEPNMYIQSNDVILQEFFEQARNQQILGRNDIFNPADMRIIRQLVGLQRFFVLARDFSIFQKNVVYARLNFNAVMFVNALALAIRERPDTQDLVMPPMNEILPELYYDNDVLYSVRNVDFEKLFNEGTPTYSKTGLLDALGLLFPGNKQYQYGVGEETTSEVVLPVEREVGGVSAKLFNDIQLDVAWKNIVIDELVKTATEGIESGEQLMGIGGGQLYYQQGQRRPHEQSGISDYKQYYYGGRQSERYGSRSYGDHAVRGGYKGRSAYMDYENYGQDFEDVNALPKVNVDSDRLLPISRRTRQKTLGYSSYVNPFYGPQNQYGYTTQEYYTYGPYGSYSPTYGPYGTYSQTYGPNGAYSQSYGPYGAYSQTYEPYGAYSQTYGPYGAYSQSYGPYEAYSQTYGPYGTYSQTYGPYGAYSQTYGGKYSQDATKYGHKSQYGYYGQKYGSHGREQYEGDYGKQNKNYGTYYNGERQQNQKQYNGYYGSSVIRPFSRQQYQPAQYGSYSKKYGSFHDSYPQQYQSQYGYKDYEGAQYDSLNKKYSNYYDIFRQQYQGAQNGYRNQEYNPYYTSRYGGLQTLKGSQFAYKNQQYGYGGAKRYGGYVEGYHGKHVQYIDAAKQLSYERRGEILLQSIQELAARFNIERYVENIEGYGYELYAQEQQQVTQLMQQIRSLIEEVCQEHGVSEGSGETLNVIADIINGRLTIYKQRQLSYETQSKLQSLQQQIAQILGYQGGEVSEITPLALFFGNLREPLTQQIIVSVAQVIGEYRQQLQPYTKQQLIGNGEIVVGNVQIDPLITYTEYYDADLINLLDQQLLQSNTNNLQRLSQKVVARQERLNHEPFTIAIDIESERSQEVVVRILLVPQIDNSGRRVSLVQNRENYIVIDAFVEQLQTGKNYIQRSSRQFNGYSNDVTTISQLYRQVMTGQITKQQQFQSGSIRQLPRNLLLPRGSKLNGGLPVQILVVVTPLSQQYREISDAGVYAQQISGFGIASVAADQLPLGYPSDRQIYDEESLNVPNIQVIETAIQYDERIRG